MVGALKLQEHNDYREEFDSWIGRQEEGYDIDRWDDIELVETFINELNLWGSQDAVVELHELEELDEEDKKGKGSGTKDACYHKVKSRYRFGPSAYASETLVKRRKKVQRTGVTVLRRKDFLIEMIFNLMKSSKREQRVK